MRSKMKSLGEFELIAHLTKALPLSSRTILGPGDDCAILAPTTHQQLFTIDSMVEDLHFRLAWGTPEKLGAKALSINLSDVAAMGGKPIACVINLAVRDGLDLRFFERLYRGVRQVAMRYKIAVVGGNITRSEKLSITIALLGEASRGVMRRNTARIGDDIFVTGTLGDSAAGLAILSNKKKAASAPLKFLVERHLNPTPRIKAGLALAKLRPVPAAIDISDGLIQDLEHILKRSRVGAEVEATALPLSKAYRATMNEDLSFALSGGEDYELLFCTRPGLSNAHLTKALGLPVHRIGKIVKGSRLIIFGKKGVVEPKIRGWDQLRAND